MHRLSKLSVLAWVVAFAAFTATPAAADPATWDQAKVTSIAKDLSKATDNWWQATLQQPDDMIGSGSAEPQMTLNNKSRTIQEMSAGLAAQLGEGKGRDKTIDMYKSIKEIADDTDVLIQRTALDEPTTNAWAKVKSQLALIAPYYTGK